MAKLVAIKKEIPATRHLRENRNRKSELHQNFFLLFIGDTDIKYLINFYKNSDLHVREN